MAGEENPLLVTPQYSRWTFIRTIIPFLFLQCSVGLYGSMQATFYPIEATQKGATSSQFGAVFGIIHLSLFIFGKCWNQVSHWSTYFSQPIRNQIHIALLVMELSLFIFGNCWKFPLDQS